jgi:hypothetical protein
MARELAARRDTNREISRASQAGTAIYDLPVDEG